MKFKNLMIFVFLFPVFIFPQPMSQLKQGFIPVVTAAQGAAGSFWRSDVWITNASGKTVEVELWVYTGTIRDESTGKKYSIPAFGSLGVENIVSDLGLQQNALYLLNIYSDENVVIGSRTYTESTERVVEHLGNLSPPFLIQKDLAQDRKLFFLYPLIFLNTG